MKTIKFLVFILLYISCSTNKNIDKFDIDEEGVVVEKANNTKQYDEVYNSNNLIYNVGKKYRYTYFYQNLNGEKFLIKRGKPILQPEGYSINDWEFIDIEQIDNETVNQIILKPNYGNSFQNEIPDYNQTVISYEYLLLSGESFVMKKIYGCTLQEVIFLKF